MNDMHEQEWNIKVIGGVHACDIISTLFRMFLHTSVYALPFCVAVSSEIKWQLYKDIIVLP